jgi:hypothetical protein
MQSHMTVGLVGLFKRCCLNLHLLSGCLSCWAYICDTYFLVYIQIFAMSSINILLYPFRTSYCLVGSYGFTINLAPFVLKSSILMLVCTQIYFDTDVAACP